MPALERQVELVGTATPEVGRLWDLALKLRYVNPDRIAWRERAWVNATRFRLRGRLAAAELARHQGQFDVILQLQSMYDLGPRPPKPFAIFTDNVFALTDRYYRDSTRLSRREAERFMAVEAAHCRAAAALFPRSEFLARSMIEDYGCDPARIVVVGAAPRYAPIDLASRTWGSRKALFVGYDFVRKGGPDLLAAWPRVRAALPDATLVVVGPPAPAGPLPEGVEWLGKVSDQATLRRLYTEADAFAMPSRYEPWGLAFQEAMAHGTAPISADFGAQPEVVRDGEWGRNVPSEDPEALAAALVEILGDAELAERLGRRGRERIAADQTWDRVAERIAARLTEIADA
jgi:glycosyltransferase involved in cell wall biosynthesis